MSIDHDIRADTYTYNMGQILTLVKESEGRYCNYGVAFLVDNNYSVGSSWYRRHPRIAGDSAGEGIGGQLSVEDKKAAIRERIANMKQ
mmetsp:Transcript_6006/g.8816  ORF Transcript_6006/g.8816 Transcript_6006/m.8816 type:complete len:88 (+) Transcript_6006:291-554(+)